MVAPCTHTLHALCTYAVHAPSRGPHAALTRPSCTQAILEGEAKKVSSFLGEAEARRGLSGYQDTQDELEKVSQQKAEVDEVKGKTLEEISQVPPPSLFPLTPPTTRPPLLPPRRA